MNSCNDRYFQLLQESMKEDHECLILCKPMVFLDENGKEKTIWQNIDGSWS